MSKGTTVQVIATRDVGKVREVVGSQVIVWHPYSGVRTYNLADVKPLYT